MEITIEMIDELIERTGVSYSQAKKALMETEGDLLKAILLIENGTTGENKTEEQEHSEASEETSNENTNNQSEPSDLQKNISEFMKLSIGISKGNKKVMNLPLWLAILFAILASEMVVPIFIIGLLLSLFGKFQFKITK
jgi:hypothetical protein